MFFHKTKHFDKLIKLPLFLIDMLTHGHDDVRYVYYELDLYLHDANYTIGSVAKLLEDLEPIPNSSIQQLFLNSRSNPLYEALLQGVKACESSLLMPLEHSFLAMLLLPIFNVQMDSAISNNKNKFVFYFCSIFVVNKIF